jgi:hypothetical protein
MLFRVRQFPAQINFFVFNRGLCRVDELHPLRAGAEYTMTFSDGSVRKGKLDSQGKAKEKDIPPGDYEVEFKEYPEPAQLDG